MENLVSRLKANPVQLVGMIGGLIVLFIIAIIPGYFIAKGDAKTGLLLYKNIAAIICLLTGLAGIGVYYARQKGTPTLPPWAQLPPELTDEGKAIMNRQSLLLSALMIVLSLLLFIAVR